MATGRYFPVQTVHLGSVGTIAGFFETTLPQPGQLGMIVEASGNVYKLVNVKNTSGVLTAAGDVCYYKDTTFTLCTTKASETVAGANGVAGGTIGAITSAQSTAGCYVFIQIGGLQAAVATDSASTVAGDYLTGDGSTDKQLHRIAAGGTMINIPWAIAVGSAAGGNNAASVRWLLGSTLC